jgi:oxygen-independent coproporphyrinogen III oxidase
VCSKGETVHVADDAGLYVHVPFCARACPYCDFDFAVGRAPPTTRYLDALALELGNRCLPGRPRTIYVGGGTPSALGPAGLEALFERLSRSLDRRGVRETTVELNPEHVDDELARTLVGVGVDRVSLGVQTFGDEGLRMLGRVHDGETARNATRRCLAAGLRVSVDLIVGWPGQTRAQLARDIDEIHALGLHHVSVYALTIEPNTPWLALVRRGRRRLPVADAQAELLLACEASLEAVGLRHYEVSSYAVAGEEGLHNAAYWAWRDYVGIGPSAASATFAADGSVVRRANRSGFEIWAGAPTDAEEEHLRPDAAAAEGLWTGLRRLDGLDLFAWSRRFVGVDRGWLDARIARQLARGNLELVPGAAGEGYGERLRVARDRWLLHDEICADLVG